MAPQQLLQQCRRGVQKLKADAAKRNYSACQDTLVELKLHLTNFPALPPRFEASPTASDEMLLARDILEQAVLLSVQMQDEASFERNFLQLNTYYTDTRDLIPKSENQLLVTGLNLLRLLVENRIAEFHVECEVIPPEAQKSPYISYVIKLEQSLMEGSYNKILDASKVCPSDTYLPFSQKLVETVRDEIRACGEEAYESLSVKDAIKVMRFTSKKDLTAYADEHGWTIDKDVVVFRTDEPDRVELNSMDLIRNTLHYAKEIERIV